MTLPRVFIGPTPLESAPRLAEVLGLTALHVKREDLSGTGLGGNKIRQIELILADARTAGADTLLTTAGAQSNFCRALAACGTKAGFRTRLLLRGTDAEPVTGNLLLMRLCGAEVSFIPPIDPWSGEVVARLEAEAADIAARGGRAHIVHLPGRTAARATQAWVQGARELDGQWKDQGLDPDTLVLAAGSGLTAAGLALGLKALGRRCRVHVVSVQQPASRLADWIAHVADETARALKLPVRLDKADFDVTDDQIGPGYAQPSAAGLDALALAARTDALLLDPAYTAKAMAGLIAGARAGRLGRSVVFLHSGGTPNLFAQAHAVAAHLGAS